MRKQILAQIIKERPDACLVKNKYKVIVGVIKRLYPNNYEKLPKEIWEKIIFDAIALDREWRMETEGKDVENKSRLEQQYIINNIL